MLIALQFFQLTAHHKQALLRIQRRRISSLQICPRHGIEAGFQLFQIAGRLRITLRQAINLGARLLQQQIDLFDLFLRLIQFGASFLAELLRRSRRAGGN